MQNIAFQPCFIRFSAGNGDLIHRSQISRYNSSNDILPTSVAMWVFKTAGASMKGSQVENRSAGQLGSPRLRREPGSGNGFAKYSMLTVFCRVFRGERAPNGGEWICIILHFDEGL